MRLLSARAVRVALSVMNNFNLATALQLLSQPHLEGLGVVHVNNIVHVQKCQLPLTLSFGTH